MEQKEQSLCEGNGGCIHLLFCEKSAFLLCAPETRVLPQELAAHSKSTLTTPTTSEAPYSQPPSCRTSFLPGPAYHTH